MAPFFDAMAVGDGEELIVEICHLLQNAKSESRISKLNRLSSLSGVYVPSVHNPLKDVISARHVESLKLEYAPSPPLVPLVEVTHDRLTVEIARGCTRGCRFCQAGMLYRPPRARSQGDILELVKSGLASSGWEEVSLLSLSSSDYPDFPALLDRVNGICLGQRVAVSVPSLRLDSFDQAMAGCLKRIKRSSLTFAPEAGSQRLRDAVNKGLSDEHLFSALELARRHGWRAVKLYFMVGLPTEKNEDLEGIASLCRRASGLGLNLKVTVSPFVPKPHTPFQWEAQCGLEDLEDKIGMLTRALRMPRVQAHWHDPRSSAVEGVLARGGRECADLIERAYFSGARSDQWTEHFRWDAWQEALAAFGLDVSQRFGGRDAAERLSWGHVDFGVNREFLLKERESALAARTTPDCREDGCHGCGAECERRKADARLTLDSAGGPCSKSEDSPSIELRIKGQNFGTGRPEAVAAAIGTFTEGSAYGRGKRAAAPRPQVSGTRFRIKYGKGPELRFISHLDLMRLWQRAVRRAGLPVAYSQGFTPHQKMSFGPPLPLGMTSRGEYLDLQLEKPFQGDIADALRQAMNPGISIFEARPVYKEGQSLSSWIGAMEYEAVWSSEKPAGFDGLMVDLSEKMKSGGSFIIKSNRKGEIIEADAAMQLLSLKIIDGNKLNIIIKVLDKGLKPVEIFQEVARVGMLTGEMEIERVEMYHLSNTALTSPFYPGSEGEFMARG
jgi:radical SAM-linked protein